MLYLFRWTSLISLYWIKIDMKSFDEFYYAIETIIVRTLGLLVICSAVRMVICDGKVAYIPWFVRPIFFFNVNSLRKWTPELYILVLCLFVALRLCSWRIVPVAFHSEWMIWCLGKCLMGNFFKKNTSSRTEVALWKNFWKAMWVITSS